MIHGERLYDQTSQQAVPTSLAWEGGGREEEGRRERVMEGRRDGGREREGGREMGREGERERATNGRGQLTKINTGTTSSFLS